MFSRTIYQNKCYIEECNIKWNISNNFLVIFTDFPCFATKWKRKIKGILKCHCKNIIYLISCKYCEKQYLGFATGFEERLRIQKSDMNTGKIRCVVTNHLRNVRCSSVS